MPGLARQVGSCESHAWKHLRKHAETMRKYAEEGENMPKSASCREVCLMECLSMGVTSVECPYIVRCLYEGVSVFPRGVCLMSSVRLVECPIYRERCVRVK